MESILKFNVVWSQQPVFWLTTNGNSSGVISIVQNEGEGMPRPPFGMALQFREIRVWASAESLATPVQ